MTIIEVEAFDSLIKCYYFLRTFIKIYSIFITVLLLRGVQFFDGSYKYLHHKYISRRSFPSIWTTGARLLPVGKMEVMYAIKVLIINYI
jgi:hypothetical protein